MFKRVTGIMCSLLAMLLLSVQVSANSALYFYEGNESGEVIIDTEGVDVFVKKERLTFDIPEFNDYFKELKSFEDYPLKLEAEYTFYP